MGSSPNAEDAYEGYVGEGRHRMPVDRRGITHKVEIQDETTGQLQEGYITANFNEDGQLGELFLSGWAKGGSTQEGWVQLCAILFSVALQFGAEFPMLARKIAHMKFPPYGPTANPEIPHCRSVPDYIMQWLVLRFGDEELKEEMFRISQELEELG